jgi:ABC-type glutathione transport system ATPase component
MEQPQLNAFSKPNPTTFLLGYLTILTCRLDRQKSARYMLNSTEMTYEVAETTNKALFLYPYSSAMMVSFECGSTRRIHMLLRMKVKGFRNLRDVEIRFGPLTCFVGPNGVGKSNIFDAIHFLKELADKDIQSAAQSVRSPARGEFGPRDLFFDGDVGHPITHTLRMW